MTDSNINNLLDNNKKEENTNEQLLETTLNNEQPSKTDLEFNKEVINSSFSNVFEQTNYTPDFNFNDYVNETFFNEETFDFATQDFSITNNIFNDFTEEKPKRDLEITDNLLKYIGVTKYIKGEGSDFGVGWDDTRKPKTRINVEKIFKEITGYSFSDVENNKISKEIIESPEFQANLDKFLSSTYKDIPFSDKVTIPDKNDDFVLQQIGGLGYEIGGGLLADAALTPLLAFGPKGWLLYGIAQFSLNAYFNIEAQKIRYGQSLTGNEDLFSWPEVISSGVVGTIPLGTELKGLKGMFRSGIYGGTLSTSEAFLRDLFGEDLDWEDYALSLGFGTVFGAGLKGSIDGLEGLYKKYNGLDLNTIKKLWTQEDTEITKKAINDLGKVKNKMDEKIEANGGNVKKIQQKIDEEVAKVKTGDTDDTTTKRVKKEDTSTVKTEVAQELTFEAPEAYKRTKPRYGSATVQFQSDFDKLSWSLRNGRKTKAQNDAKLLKVFLDQGFTEKEVRLHGDKVHAKLKSIVKEQTGSASASVTNTKGLNFEVPILKDFADKVQTKLNKLDSQDSLDLGNTQVNPQKMNRIKDMKKGKQDFVTQKVRTKKQEGGFKGAETRSQFDTQESALGKMADSKGNITGDPKRLKLITEYTKRKAFLEGKLPTEEEVVINNQGLQIATDRVASSTRNFLEVIKKNAGKNTKKSKSEIDKAGAKIIQAEQLVDDWLGMGIPLGTRLGRAMNAFKIKGIEGIEGMTPAEVMKLSPIQKKNLTQQNVDISPSLNKLLDQSADFQANLLARIKEGHETGDYSQVIKVAQDMEEASGSIENMIKLYNPNIWGKILKPASQTSRVINEIGINGVLSGPPSQIVNLKSGIAQTFLKALANFSGSLDIENGKGLVRKEALEAAKRHLFALMYNFDFSLRVWKRSWDMEDNFVNVGNSKIDTGQRSIISSESNFFPLRTAINTTGKTIRLPSRLMTSNDALIQTPNIIASTAYHATTEGLKKGLKGQELDDYIKSSIDGVISYILRGQEGPLGRLKPLEENLFSKKGIGPREFIDDPVLAKIFERAKNFGKEITYTQQIRGGRSDDVTDPLGFFAEEINNLAIQFPPVRTLFKFTRTPTNLIKDVMRYVPIVNTPARFGGRTNYNPINSLLLPEIAADLRSPNPQVRATTRGQIYLGNAFGLILTGLAYNKIYQPASEFIRSSEYDSEDEIPKTFLTDGGPNYFTKEGAAKYISLLRSGWLPYSRAYLLYDQDGEILFDGDGNPKYNYVSFEDLPDPVLSFIKLWVDFQGMSPFFTKKQDRIYDEFTIGWAAYFGRNFTNKSYIQQISETMDFFSALDEVTSGSQDPEDTISFQRQKNISYLSRLFESSITPYSSLIEDLQRMPADVMATFLNIDEQEAQKLRKEGSEGITKYAIEILGKEISFGNVKNKRIIRLFAKLDKKTYSGDFSDLTRNLKNFRFLTGEEKLGLGDYEYNEVNSYLQYLHGLVQEAKQYVPANVGGNLPFQVEHITNDVVTYPSKQGLNLFSNAKYSKSNYNIIHEATYTIGRLLPEPPNIIRGSKVKNFVKSPNFSSKLFVPIKLDNIEYNNLRKYVNTGVINFSGKNYNLADAMKAYLTNELSVTVGGFSAVELNYQANKEQIERYGLSSVQGKEAADRIYRVLNKINQQYINLGIENYLKANFTEEELETRINVKVDQQNKYNDELEGILDTLNLRRF
tara:strand:+ start:548 stop:5671 length:5124 start_codon:yes stop_codon:yes gene_type:complete